MTLQTGLLNFCRCLKKVFLLNDNTLKFILTFLLVIILLKNLILLITSYILKLNMRVLFEIRNTVFKKYLNLSYFEYRSINSTDAHNEVFQEAEVGSLCKFLF